MTYTVSAHECERIMLLYFIIINIINRLPNNLIIKLMKDKIEFSCDSDIVLSGIGVYGSLLPKKIEMKLQVYHS